MQYKNVLNGANITSAIYFFPIVIQTAAFALYIGLGFDIGIANAYTIITLFNLIKFPIRNLPIFLGQLVEFSISMKRI